MTPEVAIIERLKADATIAALVSTRVYRLKLPQGFTPPAIRVQRISDVEWPLHLRGRGTLRRMRVQIDSVTSEYDSHNPDPLGTKDELTAAIDAALVGQAFDSTDSPVSVRILAIQQADEGEDYAADELRQVRGIQDFFVIWKLLT